MQAIVFKLIVVFSLEAVVRKNSDMSAAVFLPPTTRPQFYPQAAGPALP
jgi:hypothetical protein